MPSNARVRLIVAMTAVFFSGLLALQGRWLLRSYLDVQTSYVRRIDRALAAAATHIVPGSRVFDHISALAEHGARSTGRDSTATIALRDVHRLVDIELENMELGDRYTVVLRRASEPPASWVDPIGGDTSRARMVYLPQVCPACDVRLSVALDEVKPLTFLAQMGGILSLSVALVCGMLACVLSIFTMLGQLKAERDHQMIFVNNLAHALQTPLFSISVAGQVLARSDEVRNDERLARQVAVIGRAKDRLARHTARLLDLAAIQSHVVPDDMSTIDVNVIVSRTALALEEVRGASGGSLDLDLSTAPVIVRGDAIALEEAVSNLVDNAFKYGGDTPSVLVRTQREGSRVVVTVEDHGPGVAREHRERIFAPFFRSTTGARNEVQGFGLGLSYVRAVAHQHGGAIQLRDSTSQGGASFVMSLPAATMQAPT